LASFAATDKAALVSEHCLTISKGICEMKKKMRKQHTLQVTRKLPEKITVLHCSTFLHCSDLVTLSCKLACY